MNYADFNQQQKWYINGVLGKYMDSYVRNHLIWTPEQMYHDFLAYLDEAHSKGWYGKRSRIDGKYVFINETEEKWMASEDAKEHIMTSFRKKYEKNSKLARRKGPMIDRVRFGKSWDDDESYDINFGLYKGTHNYMNTEIVEGETLIPWTIAHVNEQLKGYDTNLPEVLEQLSKSPIEIKFYKYWLDKYYDENSDLPAIIPEVRGTRNNFYCYKCNDSYYLKTKDIPRSEREIDTYRSVNIRFDFMIVNWYKQKMLFVELDGHDYHKTVGQRSKDAIKRTIATNSGFQLNVITGHQITRNIEACFDSLDAFLSK